LQQNTNFPDAYRVALSGEAAGDESDRMRATPVHFRVEHRTAKGTRRYPMVGHVARRNAAAPPHYEDVRKFIERQFPRTQYANEVCSVQ
jgi:hypothetical protein